MNMIPQTDLQQLAKIRLEEAEALEAVGKYDGCIYLCGYVAEMALKACVCKSLNVSDYPDNENGTRLLFRTHDFSQLTLLAGLRTTVATKCTESTQFANNWSLVTSWRPDFRYAVHEKTATDAQDMLEALRTTPEGLLTWLSQQW